MRTDKLFIFFITSMLALIGVSNSVAQTTKFDEGQVDFGFTSPQVFTPGGDVPRLRFLPDGKIYAAGRFAPGIGGATPIVRLLPNGQRDPTFNGPITRVEAFAVQPDAKVVYAITFIRDSYQFCAVKRLNTDGSPDTTFNFDIVTVGQINSIAVLPDGRILIAGAMTEKVEGGIIKYVARLNSNGSIDRSFGGDGNGNANKILVGPDGRIIVLSSNKVFGLTAEGQIDTAFNVYTSTTFSNDILLLTTGKILLVKPSSSEIFRLNADGTPDPTFSAPQTTFRSYAVEPDGKILLAMPEVPRMRFQRLSENGQLIERFSTFFGNGTITLDPTGTIFLSGDYTINGVSRGVYKLHKKYRPTRRKAFDFDGDGKADIAVYRPSDGVWYVFNSATGTFNFTRFGIAGDRPVSADYDGDGKADIAVFRPSTGVWYRLFSSDGHFDAVRFGLTDDIPVQNDFDGDGRDDIALFRPSNNIWYRLNSSDGSFAAFQFGLGGDKPLAGDYDGDGKADYAVYRPSDSNWYRYSSIDGSYRNDNVGYYEGNVGAPADYDGDNRLDLAYFQNSTGSWYGLKSATNGGIYLRWGATGDVPVPADYDGDGRDDIAVWRPADGTWWIVRSSDNSDFAYRFGAPGDIPVQSAYVR